MEIKIRPQKKLEQIEDNAKLSIRITLSAEGTTNKDKQELRTLWEKIDDTNDIETLLNIIKDFDKKKGD
ncbi:hypothetical protein [Clostridium saccharoperbutylacetonicum]|uniref:hypothetical protein n=1 Tax=Clostridium saccharoperbutylacetonicum TaxID=36745 RepID=UPI0039E790AE